MKKLFRTFIAVLAIGSLLVSSCKKGEGDPFISLKSRKSRMAGEWTVTAGKGSSTSSGVTSTWTYDGAQEVTTYPSPFPTSTDKYTMSWVIEKDGTFTYTNTDNNGSSAVVTTNTGTWNFTSGVGEKKNKSQVVFTILTVTSGGSTTTYTGSNAPNAVMDVYQLKNKEIIMKYSGSTNPGGSTNEGEWTWTLK